MTGTEGERVRYGQQVDPIHKQSQRARRDLAVGAAIEAALRQDRLMFAFQPVVCAATGVTDYFESLLRIRDERGTIVASGEFITVSEELGLIGHIDRYALERTVQELAAHPDVRLGFNISGLTACDRTWLRSLMSLLRERPELARRLVVEITETAALCDIEESARFIDTLRALGCRVALDDFGAGHTSLRHLQILPVDIVKIDGSLVRNLTKQSQCRVFLRHLLGLARGFGLTTVAECVESAEEATLLRAEGIGYFQGYHFGRPSLERAWLGTARVDRSELPLKL
ncbi:MAG TPA: EAL domain-containing protein [Steroidobacteraceae bacterium]|jgi:EAL domain-containing protein (putative c-di-GMP-specific phosphodiesterase class I)|nr:EAL domain-containing protein [Steroidobacteraceae bacterium]